VKHQEIMSARYQQPSGAATTWLIAWRAALESLHDRFSLLAGLVVAVVVPTMLVLTMIRPQTGPSEDGAGLGARMAANLLVVGVLPAFSAVGIAAGLFAGEKERGVLTPLLASPASNLAIFAGKVLGAIMPPLGYAILAETVYFIGILVRVGPGAITLLSPSVVAGVVLLIPGVTCFAVVVASLISSRVRTFNAAQQLSGLALMPVWGAVFGLTATLQQWAPLVLIGAVACLLLLDAGLMVLAAATWRREEVLAHR
jgi:ABC-type Na+ efflux pump permease subunit